MTTLPSERVKELIEWAEKTLELHRLHCDLPATWGVSDTMAEADLLAILDDYAALKAENEGWAEVLEDAANKHLRNLDRIAKLEAELAKHAPLMTSKEEQALNQIAEEPHTHPECPTTDEEWEAERNCRHCQAVEALDHAWEEIRNTAHRLDRAALALKMEKK